MTIHCSVSIDSKSQPVISWSPNPMDYANGSVPCMLGHPGVPGARLWSPRRPRLTSEMTRSARGLCQWAGDILLKTDGPVGSTNIVSTTNDVLVGICVTNEPTNDNMLTTTTLESPMRAARATARTDSSCTCQSTHSCCCVRRLSVSLVRS